jgi:hypothetical protein
MPTRKQRRRRQKELRHEYEYVYVDGEGQEVEVDPDELEQKGSRRNGSRETKAVAKKNGKPARPVKEVQPPSWRRVARRALIFGPLIFIAFSLINHNGSLISRLAVAAVYTLFFIPFMYLMDRAMYRSYLRKTGQPKPKPATGRKR